MDKLKSEINSWLCNYFSNKKDYNKILYDSMEYSIKVGGKRIRPILMLYSYSIYKDDYKNIMDIACAVEMIHTYSLIHDDLPSMDNDDLRRGKPTNHRVFGPAIATLAGDGLLNEAFNIMLKYSMKYGQKAIDASFEISKASGPDGMIGGQVVDIISEGKKISEDKLYYMHSNKTGALIRASIVSGGILGGASSDDLSILNEFGCKLGLAFQIQDDILDIIGDSKLMGKSIESDVSNNKTTFVSTFGLDKCIKMCENLTYECLELLNKINGNTKNLREITLFLMKRKF